MINLDDKPDVINSEVLNPIAQLKKAEIFMNWLLMKTCETW